MSSMMEFTSFFLSELPAFLMSEPICYFIGLIILSGIINLIFSLRR